MNELRTIFIISLSHAKLMIPILQIMEKGGKLNNLIVNFPNYGVVKLLQNWQKLTNIE
jgi:hypothetical protein